VGRGSWAGPVVAAAVILPVGDSSCLQALAEVRDSKLLSAHQRQRLALEIRRACVAVGVGWSSHHVIDQIGIASANRAAMLRALRRLPVQPDALLLDYVRLPESPLPQLCLVDGDALCLSIAAASIVAKVVRDRWMARCDARFPGYGFAEHKGYGTRSHREELERRGPCPLHRRSFRPIRA
jgi:ribonuclease HII